MLSFYLLKSAKIFLSAAIQIPIRFLKNFCSNYPIKLKLQVKDLKKSIELPSLNEEVLDDYFRQIFSSLRPRDLEYWQNYHLKDLEEQLIRFHRLGQELLTAKTYVLDYFNYFLSSLEEIKRILERFSQQVNQEIEYQNFHEEKYSYYIKYPEENINNGQLYFSIIELPKRIEKILHEVDYYFAALKEKQRIFHSSYFGREDDPPKYEETEVLYHTTVNADKILASGFYRGEVKTEGIGGANETKSGKKSISFTSDLYVAKEIARCLKEAILIANGEINGNDILEWSSDPEKIKKETESMYGTLDLDSPKDIFDLYRVYLAYANRYDPRFFGSSEIFIKAFQGRNPKEAGIIKAKIDMTHKDISYHQAMLEYRVPPEAVISIEGMIK